MIFSVLERARCLSRRAAGVVVACALSAEVGAVEPKVIHADVCVYGGTSGGVAAAVQAARMGQKVVIAEPGRHLGGMTSGGLSAVDIGDPRSVGGIAREYFTKLAATVGTTLAWDKPFEAKGGGPATGGAYAIEPHRAEEVFSAMVHEAGVVVYFQARLAKAHKTGPRITHLRMDDGSEFHARVFIDTTYEGDLMAKAGVSYTVTREGNAKYDETYNGIHYTAKYEPRTGHQMPGANGRVPGGQGVWDRDWPLDPYLIKGDPKSGLLPLINDGEPGTPGEPAPGVQAYCYRLCLTSDPANQIPLTPPASYDAKDYEIVARFIEACLANGDDMDLRWFSKYDALPNNKWDFNTATFGGNLPGASWEWPEASYAQREVIGKKHEDYHRGLLHFLATDPRVPVKVRKDMKRFGLPKDEFTDNGGWPHQIYVREARRMVSDLVLTEHHTFGRQVAPRSVGLGSYGTDTHEVRRIVKNGVVTREGKTAGSRGGFGPYQIGYGALVPKQAECDNLLVTFALSASHTAFSSIRMEPVFMVTSQSAATAAAIAIEADSAVQQVPYDKLRARLIQDGQILDGAKPKAQKVSASGAGVGKRATVLGVVLDDEEAVYAGSWTESNKITPLVGTHYRVTRPRGDDRVSATFAPALAASGRYEVRLLYGASSNRSSHVKVTIHAADGDHDVLINQQQECLVKGVPRALGVFDFRAGTKPAIAITNTNESGYLVIDGLQLVQEALAQRERATGADAGFPVAGKASEAALAKEAARQKIMQRAAAVAVSPLAARTVENQVLKADDEPVALAKAASPAEVAGRHFDVVVIGGTASGVACAVRAAREGCSVLLVQHNRHIGGMMSNGLMQWDALYGGPRSPLFTELLGSIEKHYVSTFGKDSQNHQVVRYTHEKYPVGWAEPHVMERECNRLIAAEPKVTLLLEHYPVAVQREGTLLKGLTLRAYGKAAEVAVSAATYVDATYEGDLLAIAKVRYRAGREARDEYQEPHAGKVFVNIDHSPPETVTEQGLNIWTYGSRQGTIDPASPFTADAAVQAYNYRFCVTKDPANRLLLSEPPPGYNRAEYVNYERKAISTNAGPSLKSHMNSPILPGENHAYPEASWDEREKIIARHRDFALGLMWFLQNDESISAKKREEYCQWGLPKDEFADNGHLPYEMYVREARRLVGRHVMTEQDGMLAEGYARTPIQPDSIAVTDWYMDSHSCTMDSSPGYRYDGKLILTEESRPAQIPYRALLPQDVDNLLVPVCLSSTHVAWGAIRLEPVWMQTGEAAGFAAALAQQQNTTPGKLDPELLLRTLVDRRQLVSFFNDVKADAKDARIPAAQFFATKGFFHDYNARLDEPVKAATLAVWAQAMKDLQAGALKPRKVAEAVAKAEAGPASQVGRKRGEVLQALYRQR